MRPKGQIFDLRSFRAKHRLTQKEIAEAVNRPQSFLSAIEHGKRSAPPGFLDDLCRIYNEENISDFLHDREDVGPQYGDISNVNDAIINSPGGVMLQNEFGNKLSKQEIARILEIEKTAMKIEAQEDAPTPASTTSTDSATISDLVKMLMEERAQRSIAENKVRELEQQVADLQAKLPKSKRK